jgi:hypothetical protein
MVGASEQTALKPDDKINLVDEIEFHASLSLLSKCRARKARDVTYAWSTGGGVKPPTETPKWAARAAEEKKEGKEQE